MMDYARNYLNTSSLADRIRESAATGKAIKVSSGLGARQERSAAREEQEDDFGTVRASYMNSIRDMFSGFTPAPAEEEEKVTPPLQVQEPMRFAGAGDYTAYQSENANRIKGKLINRGMPEHLAEAFVLNFSDESGLNSTINEQNPTVKGSRGGFGLYQLTGPRRVAYEEYAARQGINPSDPMEQEDAQISFMVEEELQGSEKGAWEKIQSADDAGTAAALIARYFLRPAKENLDARVAKYTGRPPEYITKPRAHS